MNIFKYIIEHLFKKKSVVQTLKLQGKSETEINDVPSDVKKDFLKELKSQVISEKKEIEVIECAGDGLGFKKNISC